MTRNSNLLPPHNSTAIATALMLARPEDGETLPGGGVRIMDGYGSFFVFEANESGSEVALFDTGVDPNGLRLSAAVEEKELGRDGLYVYITHAHSDHDGGLRVASKLPGYVSTSISEADSYVLDGQRHSQGPLPFLIDILSGSHKAAVPEIKPRILADNQVDTIGNLAVRTLLTPGHTDGSASFLITNSEADTTVWLPGDAFDFSRWGRVRRPAPPYTHSLKRSVTSMVRNVGIIDKLVEQGAIPQVNGVYPSHTGSGSYEAVQKFAYRHRRKAA